MNGNIIVAAILFTKILFTPFAGSAQPSDFPNDSTRAQSELKKDQMNQRTAIEAIEHASIGGAAGILIAQQMDQHAAELKRSLKGVTVERIAEGILITFPSQDLFAQDSYEILPATRARFRNLARMMNKFPHTCLLIEVHTDNTGEEVYNLTLSDKRAKSLENFLLKEGINNNRLLSKGYGNKQPIAPNSTVEGRYVNKRVEVAVFANDEMKALARKGEAGEFLAVK
jgi:outer membrane protein OmpA-like peptidoglycan-associated protein